MKPVILAFTLATAASAATTWDNSNATSLWSTAANWDTNIEPLAADDVVFPLGLAGTITLAGAETAKSLSFLDNYTLSGGTSLTLASASSVTVGAGLSATSSTPITAPGGLTKLGDGTMIFNASNTFAGGVFVNAGILRATNTGAVGAAGIVTTVNTGATLELGAITLDRPMTLNSGATFAGTTATSVSNNIHTISNAASTAVTITTRNAADVLTIGNATNDLTGGAADSVATVNGPGSVRLGAASNYAGTWQLDAGTLQLAVAGALGTNTGSTVLNGGTLSARNNAATTFTGPVNLSVIANSSLVSDRVSTSTGVTHTFGTLSMAGQTLTITPGAGATSGTAGITLGNATLTGNPTLSVVDAGVTNGKLTIGSILGGGVARTITKTGAGDLSITGGATDWITGSQLTASGGGTVEALYPALGAGASITPTSAQSPFGAAAVSITDGGLRLAMDGDGTSGAQTFLTGLAPSLAGTLTLEVDRRAAGSAKTVSLASLSLASGTSLSFSANNTYKTAITGATTLAGNATLQGTSGKTTTLTLGAISETVASTLTFGGASSTHTVNLTAASGHTGGTNVKGGTINANVNGALGTGALLIENENVSSAAKLVVASGVTLSGPTSLTMNSGTLELQSLTATSGIPMQINGGNLSLKSNTASTFSTNGSGIVFDSGAPTITVGNAGSGSSQVLNIGPLTLRNTPVITFANANSYSLTMGPLLLESDVTFNVNASVTARTSLDPNNLVAGVRESGGARKIIKSGTGTLELVGDSTTTGGLDVNAGTVLLKHNSGAGMGAITVGNGVTTGTLLLTTGISLNNAITVNGGVLGRDNSGDGHSTFNSAITLTGDVELQSNTVIPNSLREALFAGPITGAFDATVANGGIVKLQNAANTFGTGTADSIIIDAAMLAVSSDAAMGNVANGITFSGSGPDFRPDSSFTTARVFTFAHTGTAELQVNTGIELGLTSNMLGTGAISKTGEGTLVLGPLADGSSRGASLTTITDGTLRTQSITGVSATGGIAMGSDARFEMMIDADTSFPHTLTRTVTSGTAVLFVDRSPAGATTNGRHTLPAITYTSDLGDFTVQGDHGYGLTVTSLSSFGGSLVNNAPGELRIGSLTSTNTNAQTLDLGGSGNVVIQGAATQGTGSSSLKKIGSGTLTLGTSHGWLGALQCYEGVLDLNGLNVTSSSIGMGLGSALSTSTINTNGGSITLTGNVTYDENGSGVTEQGQSTINGNVNLGSATRTFTLDNSSQAAIDMQLNVILSGDPGVGLTKAGVGTLRMSGAGNTYDGLTTVSAGTLELDKSSGVAISSGGLSILNGSSTATVKLIQAAQFASSTPVIVGNSNGAASLELDNFITTFNALTLGGSQAALRVGATGTMILGGNLVFENTGSASDRNMIITSTGTKFGPASGGTLDLGGVTRTITVNNIAAPADSSPSATIETEIINGGILKTGSSGLFLANPNNTFTGGLVIAQGTVIGSAVGSFGTQPLSLTAGLGQTAALGVQTDATTITHNISTSGAGTNVLLYDGPIDTTATYSGAITLGSDLTFEVTNGEVDQNDTALMSVSGVIDDGAGSFGISKTGFGTTRLTAVNTIDGPVTVTSGRLAFSNIDALGTGATITMNGGVLEAEADIVTTKNLNFTNDSTLRASETDVGFDINGSVTTNDNDIGFIGEGQVVLTSGGGGAGGMKIGTYTNPFATETTGKSTGNFGVLSTRSGFTIPSGNILMDNYWVWELTSDMTRSLGTGAGEIQMPTGDGAGFAAFGADRTVNIGGAAATLTWGSGLFLITGTNPGNLMFGCPSATHTVNWMNPISMDNADTTPYLVFDVKDGPAAVEAVMHGGVTFTGAGQGGLDFFGNGTLHMNGAVSGNLDFYSYDAANIRLTGGCNISGDVGIEGGTVEITTATAIGGGAYAYVNFGAELDIAAAGVTLTTTPTTGYMEIGGTLTGSASAPGQFYGFGTITGNFTTAATSTYWNDSATALTVGGDLTLDTGTLLEIYLDSASIPGSYSAINAGGAVALGGTLTLDIQDGHIINPGDTFKLINKTSPGAVTGTFTGLAEGATVTAFDGEIFTISYIGGDGNDVVLTAPVTKAVATVGTYTLTPGVGAELGLHVFDMTATGTLGASYDLEASINLVDWTVVQTVTADSITGALVFHIAQSPVTFPSRFFRIR